MSFLYDSQTLGDALRHHAEVHPDRAAYIFLADGENDERKITYGELDRQARAIAARLLKIAKPGDRAVLLYPSGLEFIAAFLGCAYAGIVSVPSIIPHMKRATPRVSLILQDAGAKIICASSDIYEKLAPQFAELPETKDLQWVVNAQIPLEEADAWIKPNINGDTLCFFQYTSGSTSLPKGVMITHANLLWTIEDLYRGSQFVESDIIVTWLPIFHDLGLILGLLTPMYVGFLCVLMSPISFLERPYRWFAAITKYKANLAIAPNFAFELCADKISDEEAQTLDLSLIRQMGNAAEPVRLETLEKFRRKFEPRGFRFETFAPSYGLAEATVKVSATRFGDRMKYYYLDGGALEKNKIVIVEKDHPECYEAVGCGVSSIDADIRIVNPITRQQCAPDEVGEIWVQSQSVAQGYWNRPQISDDIFKATLDTGAGPFMRTGDMGFMIDGELFIGGRIKDMIIVQGRNYYPQDVELTVEKCHEAMRQSFGAAFAVHDEHGSERLVIVQEVKREHRGATPEQFSAMINAVRMAVAKAHGLRAHSVILIRPNTIHKTTSGKIQRAACRNSFLKKELDILAEWHAPIAVKA
jgi:acyl-CoA synthetase (AMP-forming)/AMP-acid ligase II